MSQDPILVLGIRRSGNHATVNWLLPQMPGKVRVVNDQILDEVTQGQHSLAEGRPTFHFINFDGRPHGLTDRGHLELAQTLKLEQLMDRLPRWRRKIIPMVDLYPLALEKNMPYALRQSADFLPDWNILGVENFMPEEIAAQWARLPKDDPLIPIRGPVRIVLILRNPFNHLASYIKGNLDPSEKYVAPKDFAETWCAFAREFCGETRHLAPVGTLVPFDYDRWYVDADYRKELSGKLGLEFNDSGVEQMSAVTHGSSFDKIGKDPRRMKVLERWREYEKDPDYRRWIGDPELLRLHRKIFGETPFPV